MARIPGVLENFDYRRRGRAVRCANIPDFILCFLFIISSEFVRGIGSALNGQTFTRVKIFVPQKTLMAIQKFRCIDFQETQESQGPAPRSTGQPCVGGHRCSDCLRTAGF